MALTRSFKDLVQRRVARDPSFGAALLREMIDAMLPGDTLATDPVPRDAADATEDSISCRAKQARRPRV